MTREDKSDVALLAREADPQPEQGEDGTSRVLLHVDTPKDGGRLQQGKPLLVRGYAVARDTIAEISVRLGSVTQQAAFGLHRPDLKRAFPNESKLWNAGFSRILPGVTEADGEVVLTITVKTVDGQESGQSFALTVDPTMPEAIHEVADPVDSGSAEAMLLHGERALVDRHGLLNIAGWVVSHSRIESVRVYCGAEPLGRAEYGIERPDVALAWPNFEYALGSGYLLVTDAAALGEAKSVRVVAEAFGGITREIIVPITAQNQIGRRPQRGVRDLFCDEAILTTTGHFSVKGWAVSSSAIERIEIVLGGEVIGEAERGFDRPDIGNKFPTLPGARQAGFEFAGRIDPQGVKAEHVLVLRMLGPEGEASEFKVAIVPRKSENVGAQSSAAGVELFHHLDQPNVVNGVVDRPIEGNLTIEGWALSRDGVDAVTVELDGNPAGTAYYGIRREDLEHAFPDVPNASLGGFAFSLAHRSLSEGPHRVAVQIGTKSGHKQEIAFAIDVTSAAERPGPWSLRRRLPAAESMLCRAVVRGLKLRPRVVVLVHCRRSNARELAKTLRSIAAQSYEDWAVVVSGDDKAKGVINRAEVPDLWSRGHWFPGEAQMEELLAGLRPRDLVLPLDAGDELSIDALFEFAMMAGEDESCDFLYADERRPNIATSRTEAFFKPDWSPTLLLSTNYIGRPWCAAAGLLRRMERLAPDGLIGNYDLALHCTEMANKVTHVRRVLCERGADNYEQKATEVKALKGAMKRRGLDWTIDAGRIKRTYKYRAGTYGNPLVSIIIPTIAARGLIKGCIESLRTISTYKNIEIVCIDNIKDETSEWKAWLRANADVTVEILESFNWSRFNNIGAREASGDCLLFLNDDIEVTQPDWLEAMLDHLQRKDVAIVGPQLLYPDGKVQHAGMFLAGSGIARHAFRFCPEDDPGYFGLALTARDVISVTGACLLVKRETFEALEGFEEAHAVTNNDLDFCLKAHAKNLKCVFTPHATLIHHEQASRHTMKDEHDVSAFDERWGDLGLEGDPYFHPYLDKNQDNYQAEQEPAEAVFTGRPLYRRQDVKRILVVKVDHIGDFITSLPAVRRLKEAFPNAELCMLAAPAARHLAGLEPAIDRIMAFEFFHARSALGQTEIGQDRLDALQQELAPLAFDLAIDLRKQTDTRKLLQLAGAKLTAGFDFRTQFPWLDVALTWDGDNQRSGKRQHVSDDLLNLVETVVTAGSSERSTIKRGSDWSVRQVPVISRLRTLGLYDRRIVCVHPAAGNDNKQWAPRNFAVIINVLLEAVDVDVALIGGPDEAPIAERVMEHVMEPARVHTLVGKLHLSELPYFLDSCAMFIGNDSGPKHISAALGVPTIGVHSGVIDAREWGPMGDVAVAIRRDMSCAPCYLSKREDCYRGVACLEQLDPSHLVPVCRKMLALGRGIVFAS